MSRKTRYRSSQTEYAAQYHVDARTVRRWMAKGYPLDDPQKMASVLGAQKNVPESFRDCFAAHQIHRAMIWLQNCTF